MNTTVDRSLIIKLIVLAALVLIAVWIMNNTYWAEDTIPKGLTGEAATNPFYAAQKLSGSLGARSEWKHVLGDLPSTDSIIVLAYWHWDVIAKRREQLERWVHEGGRLIVDSSLIANDTSLKEWLGIERHEVPAKHDDDTQDDDDKEEKPKKPRSPKPNFLKQAEERECDHLTLIDHRPDADANRNTYQLCSYDSYQYMTASQSVSWGLRDSHGLQAARVAVGRGSVTMFNAAPFVYREMIYGEHGLLFVAATQLRRGDHIYFLMDEDGVPLLKLIWRYGSPVVVLAGLFVLAALWRNGMRFGPMAAPRDGARRSLAEQIIGTGHFILRFNGDQALHAAAVRALTDVARKQIAHYDRLNTQERTRALAKETGLDEEALSYAIHFQGKRRAADLRHAISLLEQARRQLLSANPSHATSNHQTYN